MGKTTTGTGPEIEPEETEEVEPEETEVEPEADEEADDDEDAEAAVLAGLSDEGKALFAKYTQRLAKVSASDRNRRNIIKSFRKTGSLAPAAIGPKPVAPKAPAKTGEGAPAFDWAAERAALLAELKTEQNTTRVQTAAERALKDAGLVLPEGEAGERKLARVMRMLDLDGVEPAEVGDEVDDLKTDHPELFKARKARPRTGGVAGPGTIKPHTKGGRESELFD